MFRAASWLMWELCASQDRREGRKHRSGGWRGDISKWKLIITKDSY